MADTSTAEDRALDALTKILESAISPDMQEAQKIILHRLALSGDLFPSRVPAPRNISEIGGYLNLLEDEPALKAQVLASTLGVAGPNPPLGWEPVLPVLYFATRPNDRPTGDAQASIPLEFSVRSDFTHGLDGALDDIHTKGCTLPILTGVHSLPPLMSAGPAPAELLAFLGRAIDLVPTTALLDPSTDALAVGAASGGGSTEVLSRQLDPGAPDAGSIAAADWEIWSCDDSHCSKSTEHGKYLPITPVMNAAGWYQPSPSTPTSLSEQGTWHRWTNVTGLMPGSTFGAELALLFSAGQIAQSVIRGFATWVWSGAEFRPPDTS